MSKITLILNQIESGDLSATQNLLPMVYNELRSLARARLANEKPGQTLQATALVHEAFIRLVDSETQQHWQSRGHFFACAAEAMRRILIEQARHKKAAKSGGALQRVEMQDFGICLKASADELLALDEALDKLIVDDSAAADVARLRLFTGLTLAETSLALGLPQTTVFRHWTFARAFLQHELRHFD
jgi:RNA polymerase sigma factor (TIGR02999 family)